jgi:hypothetical protein
VRVRFHSLPLYLGDLVWASREGAIDSIGAGRGYLGAISSVLRAVRRMSIVSQTQGGEMKYGKITAAAIAVASMAAVALPGAASAKTYANPHCDNAQGPNHECALRAPFTI